MATPFVILKEFQHPPCRKSIQISKQAAGFLPVSTGECHSRSIKGHSKERRRTRNGFIVSIRSTEHVQLYSQNCAKAHRRKELCVVRELPRLGFLCVKSSIRYILRKARAFYNELACDNYNIDIPTVLGDQVMGVDPYFSIPVIHPPNAALIV